jgi:hypothetical protein
MALPKPEPVKPSETVGRRELASNLIRWTVDPHGTRQ